VSQEDERAISREGGEAADPTVPMEIGEPKAQRRMPLGPQATARLAVVMPLLHQSSHEVQKRAEGACETARSQQTPGTQRERSSMREDGEQGRVW
jgi:hypothetical protein